MKSTTQRLVVLREEYNIELVYLINTPTNAHTGYLINLKFTLKHLKRPYMFRSYDHPQGAYFVPC